MVTYIILPCKIKNIFILKFMNESKKNILLPNMTNKNHLYMLNMFLASIKSSNITILICTNGSVSIKEHQILMVIDMF